MFAWKRAVDKNTAAEYAYIMFDLKNAQAINEGKAELDTLGVKAVDDYTLEVELENPVPLLCRINFIWNILSIKREICKRKKEKSTV